MSVDLSTEARDGTQVVPALNTDIGNVLTEVLTLFPLIGGEGRSNSVDEQTENAQAAEKAREGRGRTSAVPQPPCSSLVASSPARSQLLA